MEFPEVVKKAFDGVCNSYSDFDYRIKVIKNYIGQQKYKKYKLFFRGDKCESPVTCKLFLNYYSKYCGLAQEAENFKNRSKGCDCECKDSMQCLECMQHYEGNTRLLDFTGDPLVALRFACGPENDNDDKKVTVFFTDYIVQSKEDEESNKIISAFMNLVKSPMKLSLTKDDAEKIEKDYFIIPKRDFPRIKRQDGCFLMMGNGEEKEHKVTHKISPTTGRGELYPGYVGVIHIAGAAVPQIRAKLESQEKYKMSYLMYCCPYSK